MNSPPMIKNRTALKKRFIILLSLLIIFILTIIIFFFINRYRTNNSDSDELNLVLNPSFEIWKGGVPIEWENKDVFIFDVVTSILDGEHAVGIYSRNNVNNGIYQTIQLDPDEVYYICFSLKSNSYNPKDVGFEITYSGDEIKTTADMSPGTHIYDGNKNWRQYFGSVTKAKSIKILFFSNNNNNLHIDEAWAGTKFSPVFKHQVNS